MKEHVFMSRSTLEQSRAALALKRSPIPALRKLSLEETADVLIIRGQVSTYYLKQLAQETVMPVRGNRELRNMVTVVRETVEEIS
jgi:hypothetical protein